jgi:ADP-heptose:LPS heptosyltransferase
VLVVLRALGLGDLLVGVPAYRALAEGFPEHRRVLATPAALAPLALATECFDEIVPAAPLAPFDEVREPDVAVNLHGSGPESHRVLLATKPRALIAFRHRDVRDTRGAPEWRVEEHEAARWCRLLAESGIAADATRLDLPPPDCPAPAAAFGATIVHPGAASAARRWPVERWAGIARAERDAGRTVLVTGSSAESALAADVAARAGLSPDAVLAGRTDVLELASVVAVAGRVVCGDTGVAHLATAYATPSVVLFGPIAPASWGPPRDRPCHRALWTGRRGDPHANHPDAGLLAITVDDVLAALATLPTHALRDDA